MPAPMLHVTCLTQSPFWLEGAGMWARVREMIRCLAGHSTLRVLVTTPLAHRPPPGALAAIGDFEFQSPDAAHITDEAALVRWTRAALASADCEVCWVDKTELSPLLNLAPVGARRVVDTHDILSERWRSYSGFGVGGVAPISDEEERYVLAHYDRVICIQQEDRALVSQWLGSERVLFAPHATPLHQQALRDSANAITFIASKWTTNVDGIRWFLEAVWPQVFRPGLTLNLYGWICDAVAPWHAERPIPGLRLHGHVPDLAAAYEQADILINPVRAGAGLKIKTVEALAHGLPLVTTGEGARGLRELDGHALCIADSAEDFAQAIQRLLASSAARRDLGAAAFTYAQTHFTPETCFAEIADWLARGAPAAAARLNPAVAAER